ncbi:MAG: thioredoxin domain-containing protein [Novosphingobium sp.]
MPFLRSAVLLLAAATSIGAGKPAARLGPVAPANWTATVALTPGGAHLLGNPAARVKLVEYVSYTCSHCADFEIQAGSELALGFIKPGTGSMEFRPYFRNTVDIAATLMAYCGPPSRFMGNHAALLRGQKGWLTNVTPEQQKRWRSGTFASQMQAVASDLKLYDLFIKRGYNRIELERCLANEPLARRISAENQTAESVLGIAGTPSFVLNDRLVDAADWRSLRPYLAAATR